MCDWISDNFLNILLVIISAIYTLTTNRQLTAMRDSLEETRKSNAETKKSNEIAELGRRAWLVPVDIANKGGVSVFDSGDGVQISLRNFGGTPAINAVIRTHIALVRGFPRVPETLKPRTERRSPTAVCVNEEIKVSESMPLPSSEERRQMDRRDLNFLCYCEVKYADSFGGDRVSAAAWMSNSGARWESVPELRRIE
ncbi:MAG TPA: hypothetical protein VGS22_19135 [Thermoanaerobaculia bacterium]|jgi:hypothetical protein|nr:hypothetical protein [Thermoanaerobaculia bacterium]